MKRISGHNIYKPVEKCLSVFLGRVMGRSSATGATEVPNMHGNWIWRNKQEMVFN